MTDTWDTKRLAMELLARGITASPEVAISTALKFERLWKPEEARAESELREMNAAMATYPKDADQPAVEEWWRLVLGRVRRAGEHAADRTRRNQEALR